VRYLVLLALMVAFGVACDKTDDCKRAVHHLFDITMMSPEGKDSKPSSDEQEVREMVEKASIGKCRDEGLHADARDCILAMKTLDDLMKLGDCPGIVAHHPSWVMAGPSDALPKP
jgi:hypothetical protein